jgi:hypothetical protein
MLVLSSTAGNAPLTFGLRGLVAAFFFKPAKICYAVRFLDYGETTMSGGQVPGPLGHRRDKENAVSDDQGLGVFVSAPPVGHDSAEPLTQRIVKKVVCDWVPTPNPNMTPIIVKAANLAELAQALGQLPEAGEGGGKLRIDPVPIGTSPDVTVTLHGNLVNRAAQWDGYDQASAAAKAHWDTVLGNLKRHETRHMEIAIEEGNALAQRLIGHQIGSQPTLTEKVDAANIKMKASQVKMDSPAESDHGKKQGHPYGDCNIDTTIQ